MASTKMAAGHGLGVAGHYIRWKERNDGPERRTSMLVHVPQLHGGFPAQVGLSSQGWRYVHETAHNGGLVVGRKSNKAAVVLEPGLVGTDKAGRQTEAAASWVAVGHTEKRNAEVVEVHMTVVALLAEFVVQELVLDMLVDGSLAPFLALMYVLKQERQLVTHDWRCWKISHAHQRRR